MKREVVWTWAAEAAMHYVAPVGEKALYVERAMANIVTYLPAVT